MTNEELERAVERLNDDLRLNRPGRLGTVAVSDRDLRALLSERAELLASVERMRDCLLGIALSDRYRRYPKQHEDGGVRGQSGLRAIRALTGQHGSYLNDEDVVRMDKEARAALTTGEGK
jgi:hypothetical protein